MFAFVHQNIEWSIPRVYKQRYGFLAIFDPPHLSRPVTFAFKVGFPCKLPIPGKGFKYSGKQNCHLYL